MSKEKEQTTVELQERERLAMDMEEEKHQLEEATTHLKAGLIVSASPLPLCSPSFALAPKGAHQLSELHSFSGKTQLVAVVCLMTDHAPMINAKNTLHSF